MTDNITTSFNYDSIERCIHTEINERRRASQLEPLDYDVRLSAIARTHSADMATNEYFAHESPDGDDFADRYAAAGYECRVPVSGNEYLRGGENIGKTYLQAPIEGGRYNEDAEDLATSLVDDWMNSKGHRENILDERWRCEGIGISITEEDGNLAVYATQNFC